MVRKPDRPRTTFCSHHYQGISVPKYKIIRTVFVAQYGSDVFCSGNTNAKARRMARLRVWQGQEIREFTSCVCDVESLPFCKAIAAVGGERPTEPNFFLSPGAKENANQIHLPTNT